jgi:hypothetical protein
MHQPIRDKRKMLYKSCSASLKLEFIFEKKCVHRMQQFDGPDPEIETRVYSDSHL